MLMTGTDRTLQYNIFMSQEEKEAKKMYRHQLRGERAALVLTQPESWPRCHRWEPPHLKNRNCQIFRPNLQCCGSGMNFRIRVPDPTPDPDPV